MSERVSLGAAGRRLGISGGDIRRAGYAKVTADRLAAWEHWERAGVHRAAALARAAVLNAPGEPES
jgi:hypothetical protein